MLRFVILVGVVALFYQPTSYAERQLVVERSFSASCEECNLSGRNFTGWNLEKCRLNEAKLDLTYFNSVKANSADFSSVSARGANFSTANLTKANFYEADLRHATLSGVTATMARFENALLDGANLNESSFIGSIFKSTHMPDIQAVNADFSGIRAENVGLRGAKLREAQFVGATLHNVDFSEADLSGTDFSDSVLIDIDFKTAIMDSRTDMSGACYFQTTGISDPTKSEHGIDVCDDQLLRSIGLLKERTITTD